MRESLLSPVQKLRVCYLVRRSTMVDDASWRMRHPMQPSLATLTRGISANLTNASPAAPR